MDFLAKVQVATVSGMASLVLVPYLGFLVWSKTGNIADFIRIVNLAAVILTLGHGLLLLRFLSSWPCMRTSSLSHIYWVSIALYVAPAAFILINTPTFAWDFYDLWGRRASLLASAHSEALYADIRYLLDSRHGMSLSAAFAWNAISMNLLGLSGSGTLGLAPALYLLLSVTLFLMAWARQRYRNIPLEIFLVLGVLTTPLLNNHIIIYGYSEPFVFFFLMVIMLTIIDYDPGRQIISLVTVLFSLTALAMLRNTGLLYGLTALVAWLAVYHRRFFVKTLIMMATGAGCILFALHTNAYLGSDGLPLFQLNLEKRQMLIFGKLLQFYSADPLHIFSNFFHSYVVKGSFGLSLLATSTTIAFAWHTSGRSVRYDELKPILFLALAQLMFIAQLAVVQFTEYGFQHSIPDNDTGLSRFSLPYLALSAILVCEFIRLVSHKQSTVDNSEAKIH